MLHESTQEPTVYFPRVCRAIIFALMLPYLRVSLDLQTSFSGEETVITGLGLALEAPIMSLTETSPTGIAPVGGAIHIKEGHLSGAP